MAKTRCITDGNAVKNAMRDAAKFNRGVQVETLAQALEREQRELAAAKREAAKAKATKKVENVRYAWYAEKYDPANKSTK